MVLASNKLTSIELTELQQAEAIIERGLKTFVDVGVELLGIRDKRLYRDTYTTFEEYCQERWGFARRTAYQYIDAASVVSNVRNCAQLEPTNEAQARPLTSLEPEHQVQAWQRAIDIAGERGEPVTARIVQQAVNEQKYNIVECKTCKSLFDKDSSDECPYCTKTLEQRIGHLKSPHVTNNSGNNEWYTPSEYIEAAREVMGEIDLDPASSKLANETVRAITYFTAEDDGLLYHWSGNVFMNPPYSSDMIGKFAWKLADHIVKGDVIQAVVLVNNATETAWFGELINIATAIVFPHGRIKFVDSEGNPTGTPLQGQAIIYAGDNPDIFLEVFLSFGWGAKL